MDQSNTESSKEQIIQLVKNMNQTWIKGDFSKLREYFHKHISIILGDFKRIGEGIDTCINSYKEFVANSRIFSFEETNIEAEVFENTAIAILEYKIDYEINEQRYQEEGKEILIFTKDSNKWQLCWRLIAAARA